jgi:hypothetical protein
VTTQDDLERGGEASLAFPTRLADRLARRKSREQGAKVVGDATPGPMPQRLSRADGEGDATRDCRQAFGCEPLGDPEGIGSLDETGFLGTLTSATSRGHGFLKRCFSLPGAWGNDPVRRAKARVPEGVGSPTKPKPAIALREPAWAPGVPRHWVAGEERRGTFSAGEARAPRSRGVLKGLPPTPVGIKRLSGVEPSPNPGAAPDRGAAGAGGSATTVGAVVASWPDEPWPRSTVAEGEEGATGR